MRPWIRRVAKWLVVGVVLCACAALLGVQVQQWLYRHHVERLLADLNTVELHKSTWADAQRLMHRWDRWGHYEGECSAVNCRYDILLEDVSYRWPYPESVSQDVYRVAFAIYQLLGGRTSRVTATLLVQDGLLVRSGLYASFQVPPDKKAGDEYGYGVLVAAVSLPRLGRNGEPIHLENNPYYLTVRPGGCENCMEAMLVYSDHSTTDIVRRVTSLNTSCLVGWSGCRTVEDLLPASEPFHLYDGTNGARPVSSTPDRESPIHPCAVPLWVRGRDASDIVDAEVLTIKKVEDTSYQQVESYTHATVRVLATVQGKTREGTRLEVVPFQPSQWEPGVAESLEPGKEYLLLGFEGLERRRDVPLGLRLSRCSVVLKTPEAERELRQGMLLDDSIRTEELPHFPF